ncbi:hypothetical protein [Streptomyces sp. NPDC052036]
MLDEHGPVVGHQSHGTRRSAAQTVVDRANYRNLFIADCIQADLW